jgi:putative drug exporter of the RND superfamily
MGETRTWARRGRAVPWVVVGLWLAALVLVGPLAGKFGGVQQNRAVDYLPDSADSTQVARIQDELPGGESTDLVIVYHREGGLTAADRRTAAEQIAEVADVHELSGEPRGVPSEDGSTLMYPVSSGAFPPRTAAPSCTRSPAPGPARTKKPARPSSTRCARSPTEVTAAVAG